jgi:putative oxidoreductase
MNPLRAFEAPAALIGRLLLALIFVVDGWELLSNYSGSQGYMEANGVPGALLPLAVLTEIVGGILVAIGLLTHSAAVALSGFCILTAVLFHRNFADVEQLEMAHFMKDRSDGACARGTWPRGACRSMPGGRARRP